MAKPNYGYQKYLKEQAKKKKREDKKRRKLEKKNIQIKGNSAQSSESPAAAAGENK